MVVTQFLVKHFDEHIPVLCAQVAAVVGDDAAVVQRNKVASYSHVFGLQAITYRRCLERAAPFIHLVEVVTQYCRVGYF